MTDDRNRESDLLYRRSIEATVNRIVDQRVRTAPFSSKLPKKLIRSPKSYLQIESNFVSLYVYPTSDEAAVQRRINNLGTAVPFLCQLGSYSPKIYAPLKDQYIHPLILLGDNSKIEFSGASGAMVDVPADTKFAMAGISVKIQHAHISYDVPMFLLINFGRRFRLGNAAEALEDMAIRIISETSSGTPVDGRNSGMEEQ